MQTKPVTPAELKTTREALGLPSEWVAEAGGVAVRTLRHWESGAAQVPDDVAEVLDGLAAEVGTHVAALASQTAEPVTLLRYRSQDALHQATGLTWPSTTHAIAQLRGIEALRARGMKARLIWFNPQEYAQWSANVPDATPQRWAQDQPWDDQP